MKFAHIADMHFDTPFTMLASKRNLGDLRRVEQRQALKKAIEYIKQENIKYLFLAGDMYENEYVKKTTIDFMNNLFTEIPDTKIFITPGNHDPYLKNSYYDTYNWSENVKIFKNEIEKYEDENLVIYGSGFTDFTKESINLDSINLDTSKINILITHASLDASSTLELQYNPIKSSKLKEKNFDYVALGHIHKGNYKEGGNIIYPGVPVSRGFDELGEHGMIVGDIEKGSLKLEFVKMDDREFAEVEFDVANINDKEELIERINTLNLSEQNFYKVILVGQRNFEINLNEIQKSITRENIIKIKNKTKPGYDLNVLANEQSLKGIFVKLMLQKLNSEEYDKEEIEKAIEIGLDTLSE